LTIFNTKQTLADAVSFFGPGACGILAAATGVGKSSIALSAMLDSPVPVGLVSLEDTSDVIGARLVGAICGIDSLRVRKNDLTLAEREHVKKCVADCKYEQMHFAYPTAGKLPKVEAAIAELCNAGCKLIWVDYVQEIRIGGNRERRNEVSEAMAGCHEAAAEGGAALMMISQFRRLIDGEKAPQIYHLKESGDLENKARIILLAHKVKGPESEEGQRVRFRLGKSTYGGEWLEFDYLRDESGTLRPTSLFDLLEDF
jgi:replicative DNA helicase